MICSHSHPKDLMKVKWILMEECVWNDALDIQRASLFCTSRPWTAQLITLPGRNSRRRAQAWGGWGCVFVRAPHNCATPGGNGELQRHMMACVAARVCVLLLCYWSGGQAHGEPSSAQASPVVRRLSIWTFKPRQHWGVINAIKNSSLFEERIHGHFLL